MKNRYKLLCIGIAGLALLATQCVTPNAGNGSDVGNGMVAGVLYDSDGSYAENTMVHIRKKSFLPDTLRLGLSKRTVDTVSAVTGDDGRFAFDTTLALGTYVIEATNGNKGVLIDSVVITSKASPINLPPDTLMPMGTIKGRISLPEGGDPGKVFVLAYGIDRVAIVRPDSTFTFPDLPEGVYTLKLFSKLAHYATLDTGNIEVLSEETTNVKTLEPPLTADSLSTMVSITYGNGRFLAVTDDGAMLSSSDAMTWATIKTGTTEILSGVAYGNGKFVAVGDSGMVLTSANGRDWSEKRLDSIDHFSNVTFANNRFVAISPSKTVLTSPDGSAWTKNNLNSVSLSLWSITFSDSLYVVVGNFLSEGIILTSNDFIDWAIRSPSSLKSLSSVTYGNGRFVAMGSSGTILTSPDGKTWTSQNSGISILNQFIFFCGNQFICVGDDGVILTSPDGVAWTQRTSGVTDRLNAVSFGGNQFIIVGQGGVILTSPDGATWTRKSSG
jgi:hypothetical protein